MEAVAEAGQVLGRAGGGEGAGDAEEHGGAGAQQRGGVDFARAFEHFLRVRERAGTWKGLDTGVRRLLFEEGTLAMAGGDPGDAFADLDTRTPQLPPHRQAALNAGQSTG